MIKSRLSWFGRLSHAVARGVGHPAAFILALLGVVVWAVSGPLFGFSEAWQLVVNTGTTIATFLMVFLIQSTQNRDSEALHLKLNEVIRSLEGAHNALLDLEDLDTRQLDRIKETYVRLAERARTDLDRGFPDTGVPEAEGSASYDHKGRVRGA